MPLPLLRALIFAGLVLMAGELALAPLAPLLIMATHWQIKLIVVPPAPQPEDRGMPNACVDCDLDHRI